MCGVVFVEIEGGKGLGFFFLVLLVGFVYFYFEFGVWGSGIGSEKGL